MHNFSKYNLPPAVSGCIQKHGKALLFLYATLGVYFARIFYYIVAVRPEGVYIGHPNAWSDWALHTSLTTIFATKPPSEWFLYHPYFAGGKLTYGFLTHLLSGLLMRAGISFEAAVIYPSTALMLLFLTGAYFLAEHISQSKKVALLTLFIFVFSSGLGGVEFVRELIATQNLEMLLFPPRDYTRIEEYQWLAGNIPTAILIPQRAFLMGAAIGVWSLYFFFSSAPNNQSSVYNRRRLVVAGLLAGVLPVAHMHTFIMLVVVSGIATLSYAVRDKAYVALSAYVIPAGTLSLILYGNFIHGGIQIPNFFTWQVGFTAPDGTLNWLILWWRVWGIMLPTALISLYLLKKGVLQKPNRSHVFFAGFFMLFVLGNCVLFQPTHWDNSKLFTWVYFAASLLAALLVGHLLDKKKRLYAVLAISITVLLTGTGALELVRLQNIERNTFLLSTTEDIVLAKKIQILTATDAIFATAPIHNHPINLWAARPILLGYTGWIRNFGFDYGPREQALKEIYSGGPNALQLLQEYQVAYIYVGPAEASMFTVNTMFLSQFPVVAHNQTATIYDVRMLLK